MSSSSISCHQLENERQLLPGRELVVSLSGSILTPRMAARPRAPACFEIYSTHQAADHQFVHVMFQFVMHVPDPEDWIEEVGGERKRRFHPVIIRYGGPG